MQGSNSSRLSAPPPSSIIFARSSCHTVETMIEEKSQDCNKTADTNCCSAALQRQQQQQQQQQQNAPLGGVIQPKGVNDDGDDDVGEHHLSRRCAVQCSNISLLIFKGIC